MVSSMILEEKDLNSGELPVNKIIHGDALSVLRKFPPNSIDCVITSPPYWAQRDYGEETSKIWGGDPACDHVWEDAPRREKDLSTGAFCRKCGAWFGELGLEPTPQMYVDHLIMIFRQVKKILKPHGNIFVVIDDSYSSNKGVNIPDKTLCLVPELFAVRMVYDLGFILRNKIIWAKKVNIYKERKTVGNAMPESVRDRLAHTYEYVYHFVKEPDYYYNLDSVRTPVKERTISKMISVADRIKRGELPITPKSKFYDAFLEGNLDRFGTSVRLTLRFIPDKKDTNKADNVLPPYLPLGANPGDVIFVNTESFRGAHFAVFPTRLVEFLIKVGCPDQVCKKCGAPYQPVYTEVDVDTDWRFYGADESGEYHGHGIKDYESAKAQNPSDVKRRILESLKKGKVFSGYRKTCNCNAGSEPGIVLDMFLGSGTTALVALKMGRRFIGIDLNKEYCEIAYKRIEPYIKYASLTSYIELE